MWNMESTKIVKVTLSFMRLQGASEVPHGFNMNRRPTVRYIIDCLTMRNKHTCPEVILASRRFLAASSEAEFLGR